MLVAIGIVVNFSNFSNFVNFLTSSSTVPLRHKTRDHSVRDGGSYPDFGEHIVGVFADGFHVDVVVVEGGYDHVDDADDPQVPLRVTLPFLACIEEGERAEQQHGEDETCQVEGEIRQGWWKEDVAQQHCHAYGDRTPVVEMVAVEPIEEVHPDHRQTGNVK